MKQHGFKKLLFALFLVWTSLCIITPAALALDETTLSGIPGAEQWQPYLEQSPVSISDFADAPLDALKKLFHGSMALPCRRHCVAARRRCYFCSLLRFCLF